MSLWMSFLNNVAASVFGSVLAASFCDALDRRKNRIIFWICIALIPIAQGIIYYVWEDGFLRQIYPLLVHVPLILLLCGLTGKLLWPFFSVMAAYLCCQLRRWLALLTVEILGGGALMLDAVEFIDYPATTVWTAALYDAGSPLYFLLFQKNAVSVWCDTGAILCI